MPRTGELGVSYKGCEAGSQAEIDAGERERGVTSGRVMDRFAGRSDVRPVMRHAAVAGLGTLVIVATAGAAKIGPATAAPHSPSAARPVTFVPIGSFPRRDAAALARYFGRRLGLRTSVGSRAPLPRSAFNRARNQYVAEELIEVLHRPVGDPRVVIGLTAEDIYTRDKPYWRFAFSIRSTNGFAIVSRARMDPVFLGLNPDPGLRNRRLQKMVLKTIGVLAQSPNPRSALYDSILGVDDLDYMTQEFRPQAPSAARRNWLGRSARVCLRGISDGKALIARSTVGTPAELLAFARESTGLQERHRAQLAALPPAPEDRSAVRALLALFKRAGSADRVAVAKLSANWSEATLRRWIQEGIRLSLALKSNALELGARSCGRYFDPATYAR